jgi:hypothetical protein
MTSNTHLNYEADHVWIKGPLDTEIYKTLGGYVAIKQLVPVNDPHRRKDQVVCLSAEQLPHVIGVLQALYDGSPLQKAPNLDSVA